MKKVVIGNAFSINMLSTSTTVNFKEVTENEIKEFLNGKEVISVVGHADTASVFSTILGIEIPANRMTFKWTDETTIVVGQLSGTRLPEGATTLPEGAKITWWILTK